jgi:hypothetical protein
MTSQKHSKSQPFILILALIAMLYCDSNAVRAQTFNLDITTTGLTCSKERMVFTNKSNFPLDSVKEFRWRFGDGSDIIGNTTNNTAHWKDSSGKFYHYYTGENNFDCFFSVELFNGFKDTVQIKVYTLDSIQIKLAKMPDCDDDRLGLVTNLLGRDFGNTSITYEWNHSPQRIKNRLNDTAFFSPYYDGQFVTIRMSTSQPFCLSDTKKFEPKFKVENMPLFPTAKIELFNEKIKNKFQCDAYDTTYFSNFTLKGALKTIEYLWDFGDKYAQQCTTDTKNGINIGKNCNFSYDPLPKHKYTQNDSIYWQLYKKNQPIYQTQISITGVISYSAVDTNNAALYHQLFYKQEVKPYKVILIARDTVTDCKRSDSAFVIIGRPDASLVEMRWNGRSDPYDEDYLIELNLNKNGKNALAEEYDFMYGNEDFWFKSNRGYKIENDYLLESIEQNKSLFNNWPKTIAYKYSLKYRNSGDLKEPMRVIAYMVDDFSGQKLCPDTFVIHDTPPLYKPNPKAVIQFGSTCSYEDSVEFTFEDPSFRPQSLTLETAELVYIEDLISNKKHALFANKTVSLLVRQYYSRSNPTFRFADTIVTSVYDLENVLYRPYLPPQFIDQISLKNIHLDNFPDSLIIKALGNGSSNTHIDTTGYGNEMLKAIFQRPINKQIAHPADTSIYGNTGRGKIKIKITNPNIYYDNVYFLNRVKISMTPRISAFNQIYSNYFNWEEYFSILEKDQILISDFAYINSNYPNSKYNTLYYRNSKNNTTDTIGVSFQIFYMDSLLVKNSLNSDNGGYNRTQEDQIDTNQNWFDIMTKTNYRKNVYVDWDIDDTINQKDTIIYWTNNKQAIIKTIPAKSGIFNGAVHAFNKNGCETIYPFRYDVSEVPAVNLDETIETNWVIANNCDYRLGIVNKSKLALIDPNGNPNIAPDIITKIVYHWGDGDSTVASLNDSVQHLYNAGNYVLSVSYFTKYGDVFVKNKPIDLLQLIPDVQLKYNVRNDTLWVKGPQLSDSLIGEWNFGDGKSSKVIDTYHKYATKGNYKICFTVTDTINNCSITSCDTINVGGCLAHFIPVKDSLNQFGIVILDKSQGSKLTYKWEFGDGDFSTDHYPAHTYANYGKFNLCQEVQNTNCISRYCDSIGLDSTGKLLKKAGFSIIVVDKLGSTNSSTVLKDNINLYPNPASNRINIEILDNIKINRILIYNALGGVVLESDFHDSIDVAEFKEGLYYILLDGEKGTFTKKFIIVK